MSTSSSSAAERNFKREFLKIFLIFFVFLWIFFSIIYFKFPENNKFIIQTLQLDGSEREGEALFKMNCVGCHGITARGLVLSLIHISEPTRRM